MTSDESGCPLGALAVLGALGAGTVPPLWDAQPPISGLPDDVVLHASLAGTMNVPAFHAGSGASRSWSGPGAEAFPSGQGDLPVRLTGRRKTGRPRRPGAAVGAGVLRRRRRWQGEPRAAAAPGQTCGALPSPR